MTESEYVVVLITCTAEEAGSLARALVESKKAACVNVVPRVHSRYWWNDRIEAEDESLLVVKTRVSLLDDLIGLVRQKHSYEVPEVIALPIVGGNQDYLNWIGDTLA
ncbi:MAG: divalent-cation tolerance protein CutA [Chloroflexota bacterium]|nr:divalent-cation tolerance protein CutA [Chloroflexota bacterium]